MGRISVAMVCRTDGDSPVAGYSRALVNALSGFCEVTVEAIREGNQAAAAYQEQASRINQADVIHLQHAHTDWGGARQGESGFWTWRYLLVKPLVVTSHDTRSLNDLLRDQREEESAGLPRTISDAILSRNKAHRDSIEI